MEYLNDIIKSAAIITLALLPIINPLGNIPILSSLAHGQAQTMGRMSVRVAINAWIILLGSMLVGTYVLDLFGISVPIVRLAGGMLVVVSGWRMLYSEEADAVRVAVADQAAEFSELELVKRSFFPMTFPLTAGPGAIAASIALGTASPDAPSSYFVGIATAVVGSTITMGVVYLCYRYGTRLLQRMGDIGSMVVMRIMAFILLCIGLQMMWTGWAELNGIGY